jgi:hypothetical protein
MKKRLSRSMPQTSSTEGCICAIYVYKNMSKSQIITSNYFHLSIKTNQNPYSIASPDKSVYSISTITTLLLSLDRRSELNDDTTLKSAPNCTC